MIDILVPVLGRAQNAQPLVDSIRANTRSDHRIWFLVSPDDEEQLAACAQTDALIKVMEFPAGPGDYAKKINYGYGMAVAYGCEWIFVGADDISFEPNWDMTAIKKAGDWHHVVATNDMANADVRRGRYGTHCLVRRRYITDQGGTADHVPGVVLHEGYGHWYVDRELCAVAQQRQRYVFARHSRVPHRHPVWRTAPSDDTYRKGMNSSQRDHELFLSRAHLWDYVGLNGNERKAAA